MSVKQVPRNQFKTRWYNKTLSSWLSQPAERLPGINPKPPLVRLEPLAEVKPSKLPPVRIFLGTEPAQERAQRVFVYSVAKHRNPARCYEIHLMSNIAGIERNGWKTGFTNYRYAIPSWAGGKGKAIYNDVDQIYLTDPAELFDSDLKSHGFAAISPQETSVMLIDCEKMVNYWKLEDVVAGKQQSFFKSKTTEFDLWTQMPGQWNSRDGEFPEAESKCIHFTTLHTQPWKPFEDILRYGESPVAGAWRRLEQEADSSRFLVFTKENPSVEYKLLVEQYKIMHAKSDPIASNPGKEVFDGKNVLRSAAKIKELIDHSGAVSLLDYGSGKGNFYEPAPSEKAGTRFKQYASWPGVRVICYDPGYAPFQDEWLEQTDGVVSLDVLEHIPREDIPWVLDQIFGKARKFVYVVVACYPAKKSLPNGQNAHCTVEPPGWWRDRISRTARGFPGITWVLASEELKLSRKTRLYFSNDRKFGA